jgi:hypothetical protein
MEKVPVHLWESVLVHESGILNWIPIGTSPKVCARSARNGSGF